MTDLITLVYIGQKIFNDSNGVMSSLYTTDDKRYDWTNLRHDLEKGREVSIRSASAKEMEYYNKRLDEITK